MKRLLALFALVFGMTLVVPAHARMAANAECSQPASAASTVTRTDRHGEVVSPETRRSQQDRELGKPDTGKYRTIVLPAVMLVDRPLE